MEVLITIIISTSVIFLVAHNSNKKYDRVVRNTLTSKPRKSTVKPSIINSQEGSNNRVNGNGKGLTWEEFSRLDRELFADSGILDITPSDEEVIAGFHSRSSNRHVEDIMIGNHKDRELRETDIFPSETSDALQKRIKEYTESIRLDPTSTDHYLLRGHCFADLGQHQEAITNYTEVLRLTSHDFEVYYDRGLVYGKLGQPEKVIEDLNIYIRRYPRHSMAYYNRGVAYADLGQLELALKDFDEAINKSPEDRWHGQANAYYNRGVAHGKLGLHSKAIVDFNKSIQLDPTHSDAWSNRGTARLKSGGHENKEVLNDFDTALRLNPGNKNAMQNRDMLLTRINS